MYLYRCHEVTHTHTYTHGRVMSLFTLNRDVTLERNFMERIIDEVARRMRERERERKPGIMDTVM